MGEAWSSYANYVAQVPVAFDHYLADLSLISAVLDECVLVI